MKISARELNETELNNTLHRKFNVIVIKIPTGIKSRELRETLYKEIENIKRQPSRYNTSTTEITNTLEVINRRLEEE